LAQVGPPPWVLFAEPPGKRPPPPVPEAGLGAMRLVAGLGLIVAAHAAPFTAVERVVQLLEKLQSEVEEDAKSEAAEYDKYACFCKKQADDKLYSTTKSKDKISTLNATINELQAETDELEEKKGDAETDLTAIDTEISEEQGKRDKTAAAYNTTLEDHEDGIKAITEAIEEIKKADEKNSGVTSDLLQVLKAAVQSVPAFALDQSEDKVVQILMQKPGQAHAYSSHTKELLEVLQKLRRELVDKKVEDDKAEATSLQEFERAQLKRKNLKKKLETTISRCSTRISEATEEKSNASTDKINEETKLAEDEEFLDDLTTQCENKATEWDQRSGKRTDELNAIAEALEVIKGDVTKNFGSTKKLTLAAVKDDGHRVKAESAMRAVVKRVSKLLRSLPAVSEHTHRKPISFVQLDSPTDKLMQLLTSRAKTLHSAELAALAMKVRDDPFAKVKGLIDDMITKLEEQGENDATAKENCETDLAAATGDRETLLVDIAKTEANIVQKNMEIKKLKVENKEMAAENAELQSQLQEATDLRDAESVHNAQTLEDAEEGKVAVGKAITALRRVYGEDLLQKEEPVEGTPTTSYSGDYEGKQDKGNKILGFLETIKSDFEATITAVETAETEAKTEYDTLKGNVETEVGSNDDTISDNEGSISTKETEVFDLEADLKDEKKDKDEKNAEIERIKPACVDLAINFDKRAAQRTEEIATLNEAKGLLDDVASSQGSAFLTVRK